MDPDSNLREQIEIAKEIIRRDDAGESLEDIASTALRLAELVLALAEWNAKGGHVGR